MNDHKMYQYDTGDGVVNTISVPDYGQMEVPSEGSYDLNKRTMMQKAGLLVGKTDNTMVTVKPIRQPVKRTSGYYDNDRKRRHSSEERSYGGRNDSYYGNRGRRSYSRERSYSPAHKSSYNDYHRDRYSKSDRYRSYSRSPRRSDAGKYSKSRRSYSRSASRSDSETERKRRKNNIHDDHWSSSSRGYDKSQNGGRGDYYDYDSKKRTPKSLHNNSRYDDFDEEDDDAYDKRRHDNQNGRHGGTKTDQKTPTQPRVVCTSDLSDMSSIEDEGATPAPAKDVFEVEISVPRGNKATKSTPKIVATSKKDKSSPGLTIASVTSLAERAEATEAKTNDKATTLKSDTKKKPVAKKGSGPKSSKKNHKPIDILLNPVTPENEKRRKSRSNAKPAKDRTDDNDKEADKIESSFTGDETAPHSTSPKTVGGLLFDAEEFFTRKMRLYIPRCDHPVVRAAIRAELEREANKRHQPKKDSTPPPTNTTADKRGTRNHPSKPAESPKIPVIPPISPKRGRGRPSLKSLGLSPRAAEPKPPEVSDNVSHISTRKTKRDENEKKNDEKTEVKKNEKKSGKVVGEIKVDKPVAIPNKEAKKRRPGPASKTAHYLPRVEPRMAAPAVGSASDEASSLAPPLRSTRRRSTLEVKSSTASSDNVAKEELKNSAKKGVSKEPKAVKKEPEPPVEREKTSPPPPEKKTGMAAESLVGIVANAMSIVPPALPPDNPVARLLGQVPQVAKEDMLLNLIMKIEELQTKLSHCKCSH